MQHSKWQLLVTYVVPPHAADQQEAVDGSLQRLHGLVKGLVNGHNKDRVVAVE